MNLVVATCFCFVLGTATTFKVYCEGKLVEEVRYGSPLNSEEQRLVREFLLKEWVGE